MAKSNIQNKFEAAVEKVRTAPADGPIKPSNEIKLRMYALYRQATDGDVSGKRPGLLDPVGRFKYDAWAKLAGTSKDAAMQDYVAEVAALERKYG
ncbi:MAG: Acyl-CoA-binding protein [Nevskia sp.]|nr:Acyl-CoA-binding protein [Nevskia sp.]